MACRLLAGDHPTYQQPGFQVRIWVGHEEDPEWGYAGLVVVRVQGWCPGGSWHQRKATATGRSSETQRVGVGPSVRDQGYSSRRHVFRVLIGQFRPIE